MLTDFDGCLSGEHPEGVQANGFIGPDWFCACAQDGLLLRANIFKLPLKEVAAQAIPLYKQKSGHLLSQSGDR